jgi:hypothetical protein
VDDRTRRYSKSLYKLAHRGQHGRRSRDRKPPVVEHVALRIDRDQSRRVELGGRKRVNQRKPAYRARDPRTSRNARALIAVDGANGLEENRGSSFSHTWEDAMSWKLAGSYFETCSCDVMCPCTASLALGATHDRCNATLVFNIKDGDVEGTDVSGLTVAAVADSPKVMSDGNWRLGVFIDAAASDEQAEKLGAVFSGALGGPMEALGPLVSENLGVERAPIAVQEDGLRHSIRIGDAVDFEIEDVVPFGVETGEPATLVGIFHPAGSELTVAHATRSKIDAFGIRYEGKSAFSRSSFSWAA